MNASHNHSLLLVYYFLKLLFTKFQFINCTRVYKYLFRAFL